MKSISNIIILALAFFAFAASSAYAKTPQEELPQMVEKLQKSPGDNALREQIIKLATRIEPAPAIPEEARRPFVMGATVLKKASDPAGAGKAADLFSQALNIAPWFADAYYNRAIARETAGQFELAIEDLKLYLEFKLVDRERREAQDKIYSLEAEAQVASDKKAEATSKQENEAREKAAELAKLAWILGDWTVVTPGIPGLSDSQTQRIRFIRSDDTIIDANNKVRWRGTIQPSGDIVWEIKVVVPSCGMEGGRWLPLKISFSGDRRRATVMKPIVAVDCTIKYAAYSSAEMAKE